ncbi:MAG: hypothetical protein ABIQ81_00370 [Novosphingobium sp.]
MKVMNGLDLQAQKITNLADPSANADAANKQYVDNVARGLMWKAPVRAATTTNVTISAPGATLDGVTLAATNRVLLKNQTTAAENGIYVWAASGSPLVRATDADTNGELAPGTAVSVGEGTAGADKVFVIISDAAITIGTTAQTWGQLGGAGSYSAGNGISVAGSVISAVAQVGGGVSVNAGGIALDASIAARKYSASIGNGAATSIAVTHGLGTKDVAVSLRQNADDAAVWTDWVATDANTVTLAFAAAPASNAHRITVIG